MKKGVDPDLGSQGCGTMAPHLYTLCLRDKQDEKRTTAYLIM